MLGTRTRAQVPAVEITDEQREANIAADEARREKTNKFLMNYFIIVAFGCVMAALGAVIGMAYPQFF